MHWIQQHVLRQLIKSSQLRYADIKPPQIEGSLFMYHLKGLIRDGYIRKNKEGHYELTEKGRLDADKILLETMKEHPQPRVLALIACWNKQGELLLFTRRTQPVIDMIGFPAVNVDIGQKLVDNSEKQFKKQSGLEVKLKRSGEGYINLYRGKEVESSVFFHLLEGKNPKGKLNKVIGNGEFEWYEWPLKQTKLIPSMPKLVDLLKKSKQPFFVELNYKL